MSRDKVTWIEARKFCEMKSASLLALASEAQAVQVSSFLRTQVRRHYNEFWTAGNDIAREGDWVWAEAGARVRASNDGYRRLRKVLQTLPVLGPSPG